MPRATISTESTHYDLESCPGGYVEVRRMPYGKWLERQEMAMQMKIEATQGKSLGGEIKSANRVVTAFEFKECIVDHNLEDDAGNKLDLGKPADLLRLDTMVGEEIGQIIDKLHDFNSGKSNSGFEA